MNFSQLAGERFSCRKFKDQAVEQEKIDIILKSALVAPTAVNRQPQRILVLNNNEKLSKINDCTKYGFDAPLCFIICYDKSKAYNRGYDSKNSAEIDASIVTTHMMLQAQDIGLGTTWVMAFNPQKVRECFNIPPELEILALLPTGYPADDVLINPLHSKFIDIEEMVSYNEF
ncbi:MAG: nitroreductase family protein [Eubacterium sp.]|nr:nitroreductase family protein [Eubacterium sp.]